jgi:hypothetical protein
MSIALPLQIGTRIVAVRSFGPVKRDSRVSSLALPRSDGSGG